MSSLHDPMKVQLLQILSIYKRTTNRAMSPTLFYYALVRPGMASVMIMKCVLCAMCVCVTYEVDGKKGIMITSRLEQARKAENMSGPSRPIKLRVII